MALVVQSQQTSQSKLKFQRYLTLLQGKVQVCHETIWKYDSKSYKNLVARFGPELEKFDPTFGTFKEQQITMLSRKKLSRLVFRDNGLPDSYGILIDDIEVFDMGAHPNAEECSKRYRPGSSTFNSCIDGEIDLDETAHTFNTIVHKKKGVGLVESRADVSNAFNMEGEVRGRVNFLSLGLGGKAVLSYKYEQSNKNALIDVYGKTLKIKEITWGNLTAETYPESAMVRAKLENCVEESLNGIVDIATMTTKQSLSTPLIMTRTILVMMGVR